MVGFSQHTPAAGGNGPFTFTLASGMNNGSVAATSTASVTAAASGNQLYALLSDRAGIAHTSHSVTDSNSTWTKIANYENEISDSASRITTTVWTRATVSADTSTVSVNGSVGGSNCLCSVIEISVNGTFAWVLDASSITGSGTSAIPASGQGSGSATASVEDVLVLHFGSARTGADSFSGQSFVPSTDVTQSFNGGTQSLCHCLGFDNASKASGSYSSDYDLAEGTPQAKGISGILIIEES